MEKTPGENSVDARFILREYAVSSENFPINIQEYKHVNYTWNGLQGAEEQIFESETI